MAIKKRAGFIEVNANGISLHVNIATLGAIQPIDTYPDKKGNSELNIYGLLYHVTDTTEEIFAAIEAL